MIFRRSIVVDDLVGSALVGATRHAESKVLEHLISKDNMFLIKHIMLHGRVTQVEVIATIELGSEALHACECSHRLSVTESTFSKTWS